MPKGRIRPGIMTIYALCDPKTGEVRYIGATEKSPRFRLSQHLTPKELNFTTPKSVWLRGLKARGLMPGLCILEKVDGLGWEEAEVRWIAYFREQGARLTNSTDGGLGAARGTSRHYSEAYYEAARQNGLRQRLDAPDSQTPDAIRRARVRERVHRWREKQRAQRSA